MSLWDRLPLIGRVGIVMVCAFYFVVLPAWVLWLLWEGGV